jgi:hypothetical protein
VTPRALELFDSAVKPGDTTEGWSLARRRRGAGSPSREAPSRRDPRAAFVVRVVYVVLQPRFDPTSPGRS